MKRIFERLSAGATALAIVGLLAVPPQLLRADDPPDPEPNPLWPCPLTDPDCDGWCIPPDICWKTYSDSGVDCSCLIRLE